MRKSILLSGCIIGFIPVILMAATRPIVTFYLGSDRANVFSTKTITMIAPYQNTYIGINHYDTETVGGIFLGAETVFMQNWAWQLGLSYFQSDTFQESGNVNQFSDPAYNNLTYQYQIQSQRVSLEMKLSHACNAFGKRWHPFLSADLGEAINRAYGYTEQPLSSDAVPMSQPFAGHTTHSLTYSAGLGIDLDVTENMRLGASYRFVELGSASLGTTPLQSSTNTISNAHLHTNEFLLQLSIFV